MAVPAGLQGHSSKFMIRKTVLPDTDELCQSVFHYYNEVPETGQLYEENRFS
jgi:hypothetical protein